MVNKWSPGCGCECEVGEGCTYDLASITFTTSEPCLQAVVGTWTLASVAPSSGFCDGDCVDRFQASLEFHPDSYCVVGGIGYTTIQLAVTVHRFTGSPIVRVLFSLVYHYGDNPVNFDGILVGGFYSSDNGVTFGLFQKDVPPAGCSGTSQNNPTDGDDLACSLTRV